MKKITLFFAVLLLISCGSAKNTSTINKSKDTKHVFVFVNNVSDIPISDEVKKEIIDINYSNDKNITYHLEKKEDVEYDFGLEIVIKKIDFYDREISPKVFKQTISKKSSNITSFNIQTNQSSEKQVYLPVESEFTERRFTKNCIIYGTIILFDFKSNNLILNKEIKTSKLVYSSSRETISELPKSLRFEDIAFVQNMYSPPPVDDNFIISNYNFINNIHNDYLMASYTLLDMKKNIEFFAQNLN